MLYDVKRTLGLLQCWMHFGGSVDQDQKKIASRRSASPCGRGNGTIEAVVLPSDVPIAIEIVPHSPGLLVGHTMYVICNIAIRYSVSDSAFAFAMRITIANISVHLMRVFAVYISIFDVKAHKSRW